MTKREFIELIQRKLAGGEVPADVRGKYHELIIEKYVAMAFHTHLWELAKVCQATADFTPLDDYVHDYYVDKSDIKIDTNRGQKYIDLPAPIPALIQNNAIRYCGPAAKGSRGYLYRNSSAHSVFNELDVNLVDQTVRYSPENQRVYFTNIDNPPSKILLKLITDFDAFNDGDDFPLPGGQDMLIFAQVVELLSKAPQEDLKNDNVINAEHPGN